MANARVRGEPQGSLLPGKCYVRGGVGACRPRILHEYSNGPGAAGRAAALCVILKWGMLHFLGGAALGLGLFAVFIYPAGDGIVVAVKTQ